MILLAELHNTAVQNIALTKLLKEHGWMCTSSAAVATDRSLKGTSAGVLAGIRQNRSNRPLSICSDVEGKTTHNPQLTGRLLVLKHV